MEETKTEDIMAELLAPTSAMETIDYSLKESCGIVDCNPDEEDEDEYFYEDEEDEDEPYNIEDEYVRRMSMAVDWLNDAIYRADNYNYTEDSYRHFINCIEELMEAAGRLESASEDYYE